MEIRDSVMSSIRSILENYAYKAMNEFDDNHEIIISTDQAIKEIEEAINAAKPGDRIFDIKMSDTQIHMMDSYNVGIAKYQSNIEELLK